MSKALPLATFPVDVPVHNLGGLPAVTRMLDVHKRRYESGSTMAILIALDICAEWELALPPWLATAFRTQLGAFLTPGPRKSLDSVFYFPDHQDAPPSKIARLINDWQLGMALWAAVGMAVHADRDAQSFDKELRRVLRAGNAGRPWGVGLTKARELVRMIEDSQSELLGKPSRQHLWAVVDDRKRAARAASVGTRQDLSRKRGKRRKP